jgi:predicted nucleic acid-binding protein
VLLSSLLLAEPGDAEQALRLFERHVGLNAADSFLAAMTMRAGAELISADRGFADTPKLRLIDPGSPQIDGLVGPPKH